MGQPKVAMIKARVAPWIAEGINKLAEETGQSQSVIIRAAVVDHLKRETARLKAEAAAEGGDPVEAAAIKLVKEALRVSKQRRPRRS